MTKQAAKPAKKRASIKIDGTEYIIPTMKFKVLKRAFPIMMKSGDMTDPMELASLGIEVISMALMQTHPEMTPDWIEENIESSETFGLDKTLLQIMVDNGVMTEEQLKGGENKPGEAKGAAPSTETLTPSSQNSSQPDAAEETGT